ncbi:MAG: YbbR-like domain-containing protein [Bacteroidia bacterium]|nr:YbbR-like domain-containing protein [Bacteroidia bacterium]
MDFASTKDKWIPKIRSFFSNLNWKNILLFFGFFILAFIFWLMLFFQRDIEATYKIPLRYTNIPDDVVFNTSLPNDIEIRLADKGSEIFRYTFTLKDSIEIDIAKYKEDRINNLQGTELTQLIRAQLSQSTNLKAYYPINISLATSKLQKKELKVVFDGVISTSRNNLVTDSATFLPKTVTAYGSQSQLAEISTAVTEYTLFNNLKATSQLKVKIMPVSGIKFIPDEVEIYISVLEYTERKFEVPITVRNVPDNIDVKFFPSQTEVSFSVTLEEYKKIIPEDFKVELDYRKFFKNENGRVDLELSENPSAIRNTKLSPSSVEFLLESR